MNPFSLYNSLDAALDDGRTQIEYNIENRLFLNEMEYSSELIKKKKENQVFW